MTTQSTYKLVIIGDASVGKTTFINRHRTGEFKKEYIPTMGVEVSPLSFNTSSPITGKGKYTFKVWDCAGKHRGIEDGYYIGANACIILFDLTNLESLRNVPEWIRKFENVCPNVPIIICGTKCDVLTRFTHIPLLKKCLYISSRSNFNYEKPFLFLLRKLTGDNLLAFREESPPVHETFEDVFENLLKKSNIVCPCN